jgi:hypothetical protein
VAARRDRALKKAAAGADLRGVSVALQMVLQLERVEYRLVAE